MENRKNFIIVVICMAFGTILLITMKDLYRLKVQFVRNKSATNGHSEEIPKLAYDTTLERLKGDGDSAQQLNSPNSQEGVGSASYPSISAAKVVAAQQGHSPVESHADRCTNCCRQSERLFHIDEYCSQHPDLQDYLRDPRNARTPFRFVHVSRNHKVLMCLNMKAGSRLWGDTLVRSSSLLQKKINQSAPYVNSIFYDDLLTEIGIVNLRDLSSEDILNTLSTYTKVIIVRHPIERILSAYRDKFVYSPMGEGSLAGYNYVLERYRHLPRSTLTTLDTRHMLGEEKISLDEFVRMVTDPDAPFNVHWDQYVTNCNPCVIKYDYVIRSETNRWDAPPVMEILSRGVNSQLLQHRLISRDKEELKKNLDEPVLQKELHEFASVDKSNLDKLLEHFVNDMKMFGYRFNASTMQASCDLTNTWNSGCC